MTRLLSPEDFVGAPRTFTPDEFVGAPPLGRPEAPPQPLPFDFLAAPRPAPAPLGMPKLPEPPLAIPPPSAPPAGGYPVPASPGDLPGQMRANPGLAAQLDSGWASRALGRTYQNTRSGFEGMAAAARATNLDMVDQWSALTEEMSKPIAEDRYRRLSTQRRLIEQELRTAAPGDYDLANPADRETLKARLAGRFLENAASVERRRRKVETDYPRDPDTERALNQKGKSFGDAASGFWQEFSRSPLKMIGEIGLESSLQSAAAIGTGLLTRSPAMAGTAMGVLSGAQEYGSGLFEVMRDAGIDTADPKAVLAALRDPKKGAEIRNLATAKAVPVALLDALSMKLAGVLLAPRALGPVGQRVANVPMQTGAQGLMGGTGEALGQVAQKGKIENWGDIFAEVVGEAASAPVDVLGMRSALRRPGAAVARPQGPPQGLPPLELRNPLDAPPVPPSPTPPPVAPLPSRGEFPRIEGFTRDRLARDGWSATRDLAGAAPRADVTQYWTVTGPDGRTFQIPLDARELPEGVPPSPESFRDLAIRRAKREATDGPVPSFVDMPALPPPAPAPEPIAPVPPAPRPPVEPSAPIPPAGPIGRAAGSVDALAPADTTFTPSGRKVSIRYEVVDADQLTPSHTDELSPNPRFPADLQPRDRTRAASEAQISEIAAKLEPQRLGRSADATTGAPIVGPDGVVESGNGRVLALRRAYAQHPDRAGAYRAWLRSQGFNVEGMARPVLIARRVSDLSPADRAAFAREANASTALRMSSPEQAASDARTVRGIIEQFRGGDVTFAQNAGFVRSFINALPPSERGSLWTDKAGLSQEGARRIQGALLHAAYDDSALVSKVFESASNDIKSIGGALLDVAPAWAKMRARAARGEINPGVDRTADLIAAVRAIEEARSKGMLASDVFSQGGLFTSLDAARDFGALFFNDPAMKKPASRESVAARLRNYVEQAEKTGSDPDMFGQAPASAKDILGATRNKGLLSADEFAGFSDALFDPEPQPREVPANNYVTRLSDYAPRMYRETSLSELERFIPTGRSFEPLSESLFLADTPNLARGQGENRGVLLAFDASGLRGYVNKGKPGWEPVWRSGEGEFQTSEMVQANYRQALQGFRVYKDAKADKITKARLPLLLRDLEAKGWTKTETSEFTEYRRPVSSMTLRSGFDPTAPYSWYQLRAQKVLDFIHNRGGYRLAPLRNLPQEKEYLTARYQALGKLAEVDAIAHEIFKAFRGSKADKTQAHAYLTTKGAKPESITNPKTRAAAVEAKRMLEQVGRRLVDRGLLSEEVFEAHRGEYLPNIYVKHLLADRMSAGRTKLDLGYLKKRQDIPEDVKRLILGQITDPGYLSARGYNVPMRDMVFQDFLEQLAANNEWVLRESLVTWEGNQVSAAWLWNEAARLRKMAEHAGEDREAILEIAYRMETTARPGLAVEKVGDYKQVPDSPKYGKLRGLWIRREVWDDLFGNLGFLVDDPSFAERILGQRGLLSRATQMWKLVKVPLNPPTIVRNTLGNVLLLQMSGVPLVRLPDRLIQAAIEVATNGRHWRAAKKYGVSSANFAHAELYRLDRFARTVLNTSKNPMVKIAGFVAGMIDKAAGFYGTMEAVAKTAKMIDAIEREGMSEADAALEAHKAIFDYSLIPPTVRYLRNAPIGMPFVTFNYKVAPRLLEMAIKHPLRLWPYLAAASILPALAMDGLDLDEEEYRALKKSLPKYMRERGHVYLLPWKDEFGRYQIVDVSGFMPWNFFQDVGQEIGKGEIGDAIYKTGFGGPLAQIISALYTNRDPFTKRDIANPADPPGVRLRDELNYAWRMMSPGWLTDQGAAGKFQDLAEGKVDKRTGLPLLTEEQAASRMFGANTYPVDPQRSRAAEIGRMTRELRDIQRRMGQVLFDRNLTPEQRKAKRDEYLGYYKEKAAELRDYSKETLKAPRVPRLPAAPPPR